MSGKIEARLSELGIVLPPAPSPVANYQTYLATGSLLFISGQISKDGNGVLLAGHLGEQLTAEDGAKAARVCALNILAQAQAALGTLDNVARIVRLNGFVTAAPGFTEHPQVINGASDLMVEVFQDRGRHTRAAIGVASLPAGAAVEIDAVIEIASSNAR